MASKSAFRTELENAVLERHCANHPMTNKWAEGELGRNACMGWAVEHWHWTSNIVNEVSFNIARHAPEDVVALELDNFLEETDPERSHLDIVLRFAEANGADLAKVKAGRGLPTTRSWVAFLRNVAKAEPWHAAVAAIRIGTESQSPMLYSKVLPALREKYKYDEDAIEHGDVTGCAKQRQAQRQSRQHREAEGCCSAGQGYGELGCKDLPAWYRSGEDHRHRA